jgi:hypothetical protein
MAAFVAPESFVASGNKSSRFVTVISMQNGIQQKAQVEVPVDNSENHIDNLMELIMNLINKKDNKDKDEDAVVKNFDNAVQTFAAVSNAASNTASNADAEINVATIAAILADTTLD